MASVASADVRPGGCGVCISAEALAGLVNRLGPSATTAFLAVAADAVRNERGALVATTSARSLARQLHVAKDTAAGVLGLLVRRGYLRRLAQPRIGGRFASARYVVKAPVGFAVVPCAASEDTAAQTRPDHTSASASPADRPHRVRRARRAEPSQLGLFVTPSETTDTRSPS